MKTIAISCLILLLYAVLYTAAVLARRHYRRMRSIISIRESVSLVNMPVVTFMQGDTKLKFLLDSGSDSNVICKDTLQKGLSCTMSDEKMRISGVTGENNISERGVNIPFTYDSLKFETVLFPVDRGSAFDDLESKTGVRIDGILGTPFMVAYKYLIDFNELKVKIK